MLSVSTVQQNDPDICIYIYTYIYIYTHICSFSHIILHHVPSQVARYSPCANSLIAYPLQRQELASINPKFPVHPSPFSLATMSLFSKSVSFFSVEKFLCAIMYYVI